jgi:triosephosphate isomerase
VHALRDGVGAAPACDVALAVPAPYLAQVQALAAGSGLALAAQDVSQHESGAYTGEFSAAMLRDFAVRYVLVGHSERRQYHGETDVHVAVKAQRALAAGITPIVCVGETLEEREAGQTEAVVRRQLAAVIHLNGHCISEVVVAYEPVWAIGTGKNRHARAGTAGACRVACAACSGQPPCGQDSLAVRRQHECRECGAVAGPARYRRRSGGRCFAQGCRLFANYCRSPITAGGTRY